MSRAIADPDGAGRLVKVMERAPPWEIAWLQDKRGVSLRQSLWLREPFRRNILELFGGQALVFKHGPVDRGRLLAKQERFETENEERRGVWYRKIFNSISMEIRLRRLSDYIEAT